VSRPRAVPHHDDPTGGLPMIEIDGHRVLTTLEEKVAPGTAAVIVIDMQKDFTYPGWFSDRLGIDVSPMNALAEHIAKLLKEARKHGVMVVHVNSVYDKRFMSAPMHERLHRLNLDPYCQSDTEGIDSHPALVPRPGEPVVIKHRFDAFVDTDLDIVLRSAGIETVIMTGTATHACVDSTARNAYFRDYYVVFGEDLVGGASEEVHRATMATVNQCFGVTATAEQLMAAWEVGASGGEAVAAGGAGRHAD
jgi:ureidoacrylate peracid hydrolase